MEKKPARVFPRVMYRGESDTLGEGRGETIRAEDEGHMAELKKDGWREERDDPNHPHIDAAGTIQIPAQEVFVDAESAKATVEAAARKKHEAEHDLVKRDAAVRRARDADAKADKK